MADQQPQPGQQYGEPIPVPGNSGVTIHPPASQPQPPAQQTNAPPRNEPPPSQPPAFNPPVQPPDNSQVVAGLQSIGQTLQALPEQIVNSFREATQSQQLPAQPSQPAGQPSGTQQPTGQQQPPQQPSQPSEPAQQPTQQQGRRTFGDWWFDR